MKKNHWLLFLAVFCVVQSTFGQIGKTQDRLAVHNWQLSDLDKVGISKLYPAISYRSQQDNWRWCNKCQGLFFGGNASKGVCFDKQAHSSQGSGNYALIQGAGTFVQDNWRWCHKCQGLFFTGNGTAGVCFKGGSHASSGSGNYHLEQNSSLLSTDFQAGWTWCSRCEGLYFGEGKNKGACPAGGLHVNSGSGNYVLIQK